MVSRVLRATPAHVRLRRRPGLQPCRRALRRLETAGSSWGIARLLEPGCRKWSRGFIGTTPLGRRRPDNAPRAARASDRDRGLSLDRGGRGLHPVRAGGDSADLEALIRDIRLAASVRTRTTVVLQTYRRERPIYILFVRVADPARPRRRSPATSASQASVRHDVTAAVRGTCYENRPISLRWAGPGAHGLPSRRTRMTWLRERAAAAQRDTLRLMESVTAACRRWPTVSGLLIVLNAQSGTAVVRADPRPVFAERLPAATVHELEEGEDLADAVASRMSRRRCTDGARRLRRRRLGVAHGRARPSLRRAAAGDAGRDLQPLRAIDRAR